MSAGLSVERIDWRGALCWRCSREPAAAVLDGLTVLGWSCIAVQLDEWHAQLHQLGRTDRDIERELHAEERPARLPRLLTPPERVELCRHCKRAEQEVSWLASEGWPRDCALCRWCW